MTPDDNNKDKVIKQAREITADSRNTIIGKGRTRVADTLDLDFDFDFKKRTIIVAPTESDEDMRSSAQEFIMPDLEDINEPYKTQEFDRSELEQAAAEEGIDLNEEAEISSAEIPAAEIQEEEPQEDAPLEEAPAEGNNIDTSADTADADEEIESEPETEAETETQTETEDETEAASEDPSSEEITEPSEPEKTEAHSKETDDSDTDTETDSDIDADGIDAETAEYFYEEEEEEHKRRRFGLIPDILRVPDESELDAADPDLDKLLEPSHPFSIKKKRHALKAVFRGDEASDTTIVTGKVPLMKDNKAKSIARSKAAKSGSSSKASTNKSSGAKGGTAKAGTAAAAKSGAKGSGGGNTGRKKPAKKKKKRNKLWVFVRSLIITFISLGILGGIAGGAYAAYVISNADTIHPDTIYDTLAVSTYIYDDKEKLIDEIYYNENRQIITYDELPDNLKNAFIAIEDKTFWTHKGFNFRRIVGAILERFHGGRISGTSTITQQLARNVFLPEDKSVRSIKRKIIEMYYAYEIEEELSKEDILTAYLNTIYLGYGCYGVDTAASKYFSCRVQDLTLEQCAALAALPQAPGSYQLIVNEKGDYTTKIKKGLYANDTSESRRNLVLQLMYEQGYITEEQKDEATKPLIDFIKPGGVSTATSTSAFKDYLIETVKNDLMEQYGLTEEQAVKLIYTKGLRIYSTLDSQAQKVITKEFKESSNFPSTNKKKVKPEAAMVISEVGTGKIKAMVGSRYADGQMLFNRATNPRQPGSSIKPLTVYSAALQKSYEYQKQGKKFQFKDTGYDKQGTRNWGDYITVSSQVTDEKMTVNGKTWPLNVTRTYSGSNSFRTAIQKSINTCAVKILAQVGISYSMEMLQKFGITSAVDDTSEPVNDVNLAALALGAMSEGISPLEMSLAYAAFPNKGVRNTGICYTRVEDNKGRTILEAKSDTVKVLNPGVAWIMTNVLQSVVTNGIGYPAAVDGIKVGGKTGTTDSRYDIWFAGFTPSYSAALWIGTDENVQMDSYSEKAAALWGEIMGQVKRAKKGSYPGMPNNVFRAWNGEYYTDGTAPPEPEPEPEEEEGEEGKDGKGDKADSTKPGDKDPGKTDSKKD